MADLAGTDQPRQMTTGVVVSYDAEKTVYRIFLDVGQAIDARLLDTGNTRALKTDDKVLCIRATTTQWLILGKVPTISRDITSDPEVNRQLNLFPTTPQSNQETPSFRQPGNNDSLGTGDQQILAKSSSSFARIALWAAGGALIEVGRRTYRFFNGTLGIIKDFCFSYVLSVPGATAALFAKSQEKKTQGSIDIQPFLQEGFNETDRLTMIAGADAVSQDGESPIERKQGSCGEVTSATTGKPGISLILGEFIKALMDSQSGKVKISLGENNVFEFDLQELRAALSDTSLTMGADGIVLQKGNETINLGLEELIFTVTALTMTITNAVNVTASEVNIQGVTSINGYKFVEDLITTLNNQWLLLYNTHVHTSDVPGAPTSPPTGGTFPPIVPSG